MKLILILLLLMSCGSTPKDLSVPELNNHFRMEMKVNGVTSLGLSGFSYDDTETLKAHTLRFYPIHEGIIDLWSERCSRTYSFAYKRGQEIAINLFDLLPPSGQATSCVYRTMQRVKGADNVMVGLFGLAYTGEALPLKTEILGQSFHGISWMQKKQGNVIPSEANTIKVWPTGQSGNISFRGCGIQSSRDFTATPIILRLHEIIPSLETKHSCNYVITIANYDNPYVEQHTLMLNVYKSETTFIDPPKVDFNKRKSRLEVKFDNPYILGTSVNERVCIRRRNCTGTCKENESCTVRAITSSGRYFWAIVKNGNIVEVK